MSIEPLLLHKVLRTNSLDTIELPFPNRSTGKGEKNPMGIKREWNQVI